MSNDKEGRAKRAGNEQRCGVKCGAMEHVSYNKFSIKISYKLENLKKNIMEMGGEEV